VIKAFSIDTSPIGRPKTYLVICLSRTTSQRTPSTHTYRPSPSECTHRTRSTFTSDVRSRFRNDVRAVHFAGALKPWQLTYNPESGLLSGNMGSSNDIQRDFLASWWRMMYDNVWPRLSKINQVKALCRVCLHCIRMLCVCPVCSVGARCSIVGRR
jgi:hypothetical protein